METSQRDALEIDIKYFFDRSLTADITGRLNRVRLVNESVAITIIKLDQMRNLQYMAGELVPLPQLIRTLDVSVPTAGH